MRRRGMITFLLVNVVISAAIAFGVISLLGGGSSEPNEVLVTFPVIITATRDPLVTPNVIVVTATDDPDLPPRAIIPDDVREGTVVAQAGPLPTIDLTAELSTPAEGDSALPEGCILHTLQEGEFPSSLAVQYEVSMFDILSANGLTEEEAMLLQIGEELIIPLDGCPLEDFIAAQPTDVPTETPTPEEEPTEVTAEVEDDVTPTATLTPTSTNTPTITPTPTETPIPTITLAPTAGNAQVEIVEIIGRGDITTEGVVIRNNGNTVDISGWTLNDADGNVFVFPDGRRLFSGASITVYTRAGEDTAVVFYWGRDTAVFGEAGAGGEVVVLANRDGQSQASLRLP